MAPTILSGQAVSLHLGAEVVLQPLEAAVSGHW